MIGEASDFQQNCIFVSEKGNNFFGPSLKAAARDSETILVNLGLGLALFHHFHGYSQIFKI